MKGKPYEVAKNITEGTKEQLLSSILLLRGFGATLERYLEGLHPGTMEEYMKKFEDVK